MNNKNRNQKRLFEMLVLILCSVNTAIAGEVIEEPYVFPSDGPALYAEENTFLICDECKGPEPLVLIPTHPLVIRESGIDKDALARLNSSEIRTEAIPPKKTKETLKTPKIGTRDSDGKNLNVRAKPIKTHTFTIHFAFDSDAITDYSEKRLKTVLKKINTLKGEKTIRLTGYSCDIGPDAYNKALSRRRAESVMHFFEKHQMKPQTVSGKGGCCPVSQERRLNRRVEIIVEEGEKR